MFKAKRSLVVSSLLITMGMVYVGFGHPTPMGVPQANLYGHHDETHSREREDRWRDHHARSHSPQRRWPRGTQRPSFDPPKDRQEKQSEPEVAESDSPAEAKSAFAFVSESREKTNSRSQEGRRSGGPRWPGSRPANFTPPPAWYHAPRPPQLGGEPGVLMPEPIRAKLKLNAAQHRELDQLQQELEQRLQAVLTPEQFAQLEALREEFLDQETRSRQ